MTTCAGAILSSVADFNPNGMLPLHAACCAGVWDNNNRAESEPPLLGPAPGGSSPIIETKRMRDQLHQLRGQLREAQDGCRQHQQQQAAADKRAGEYLRQLQTRGELILLLQAQLSDLQDVNTQLREQLAAGGAPPAGAAAAEGDGSQQHKEAGTPRDTRSGGSLTGAATGTVTAADAASSNGNTAEPQSAAACCQHEAVIQQLQQQLQMQTDQIQRLRQERAEAALAPPAVAPVVVEVSARTDDLAVDVDTSTPHDSQEVSTSAAAIQAMSCLKQQEAKHQQLLKQYDDLTAFVKQLEAQGNQREALMGGLLAQVGQAHAAAVHAVARSVACQATKSMQHRSPLCRRPPFTCPCC